MNDMNGAVRDDLILQMLELDLHGVENFIISGLVYTRRIKKDAIDCVNKKLQEICKYQNCKFLNNSHIQVEHLC